MGSMAIFFWFSLNKTVIPLFSLELNPMEKELLIKSEIPQVLSSASKIVGILYSPSEMSEGRASLTPNTRSFCPVHSYPGETIAFLGRQVSLLHRLCETLVRS